MDHTRTQEHVRTQKNTREETERHDKPKKLNSLDNTFGNAQRLVRSLEPRIAMSPLQYAGLTAEDPPDRFLAKAPKTYKVSDGVVTLQGRVRGRCFSGLR